MDGGVPRVAIIGNGAVGRGMAELFPGAAVYDEPLGIGSRAGVNAADFAFVCVPTPAAEDGSCDTRIVEDVVGWLSGPLIVLRSTVSPGTTSRLRVATGKRIVFQPEYGPGETSDHPFQSSRDIRWIILGGERRDTNAVADLYKLVFNSSLVVQQTTAETAELCKYMENAFLAMKVAFCNEFYDLAALWGADYDELRELWLLDPRIGRSHTWVHPGDRGFGGKCLPKDLDAIIAAARARGGDAALLQGVRAANDRVRNAQGQGGPARGGGTLP